MAVDPPLSEAQSQQILRILPALVYFVLEEDVDEVLRSVALDAVLYLGYASTKEGPGPIGTAEAVDKSQKSSAFESISAALQVRLTILPPYIAVLLTVTLITGNNHALRGNSPTTTTRAQCPGTRSQGARPVPEASARPTSGTGPARRAHCNITQEYKSAY